MSHRRSDIWKLLLALAAGIVHILMSNTPNAAAHPIGDFAVSRYSRLEVGAERLLVYYVVDMAEIPTFQERPLIDSDRDGQIDEAEATAYALSKAEAIRQGLGLTLNGAPAELKVIDYALTFPPGRGDLATLRLEVVLVTAIPNEEPIAIIYRDDNEPERDGWREIIMQAGAGRSLHDPTVPATDLSNALRTYPDALLNNPPYMRVARATALPEAGAGASPAPAPAPVERRTDPFVALVTTEALSLPALLLSLMVAFGLGAVHALSPGHGKAMVGAYLVGARGTTRHALLLGLTVTITHTIGVFALGLVTLLLSQFILPEQLYPWLGATSGLLVCGIGLGLFWSRVREWRLATPPGQLASISTASGWHRHGDAWHVHTHSHAEEAHSGHGHHHGPGGHTHTVPREGITWRSLMALGVSGGLLPCPSALVVLLSAIALHRVGLGLLLIVAFSAGLAAVLTGIGLLIVHAGRLLDRLPVKSRLQRGVPVASALLVAIAGLAITLQALSETGLPRW